MSADRSPPLRRFPWAAIALVSLAINLLALGVVIGASAGGLRLAARTPPQAAQVVAQRPLLLQREFLQALPDAERRTLQADLGAAWREARPLRREARAAREALARALVAEPFDPDAAQAAFARTRAADAAVQTAVQEASVAALAKLTPAARQAAFAASRQRSPPAGAPPR